MTHQKKHPAASIEPLEQEEWERSPAGTES
jgi:hypothetical protein